MSIKETTGVKVQICAFCGEEKPIIANGLCNACNRVYERNETKEHPNKFLKKCSVEFCERAVIAHDLCDKHYRRWKRHGHLDQTREKGWGSKEKHPLYQIWSWRKRTKQLCEAWIKDFWLFAEEVGVKEEGATLQRIDETQPYSNINFEWVEPVMSVDTKANDAMAQRAAYGREWRKKNQRKCKDSDLKRYHGITLDEYDNMMKNQGFVCAICGKKERVVNGITGKVFNLAVDHCHKTNVVRGLLCVNCNKAIGHLNDSIPLLNSAINYLKSHASSEA